MVFQLMVVRNPGSNFREVFFGDDATGRSAPSQRNGEVPNRTVSLATRALAGRVPTSHVALNYRPAQDLRYRRQQFGQALLALTQGEFRKPA